MRGLGTSLPDRFHAAADISADGSIIVGPPAGFTATAFIWDQVHGIRKLNDFLTNELGLDLTGWTLHSAAAISDDGRKIVGSGTNPRGQTEAWLAVIGEGPATPTPTAPPEPCDVTWGVNSITTIGKSNSPTNNLKVSHLITGHIVNPAALCASDGPCTAHRIPVCAGTEVNIAVTGSGDNANIGKGSISCDAAGCVVTSIIVTEKYKSVSADGKDTDRVTLLPQ